MIIDHIGIVVKSINAAISYWVDVFEYLYFNQLKQWKTILPWSFNPGNVIIRCSRE